MSETAGARCLNRRIAGACLIAAPAVLLVGALVHPQVGHDASAHLAVAAQSPGRYYAAHAIILVGLVLFLPALLALVHPLRGTATALGLVGCALAIIGLFGATAVVAVDGIAVSQMAQPEANAEEMAALLERIKASSGLRAIAIIGALSFLSGVLLLAFGYWRYRAASHWMAAGLAAAAITFFVGQVTDNRTVFAAAFAIYLLVLGPLGWATVRASDDALVGSKDCAR